MESWKDLDKKFSDLVKGKSIALVGPAGSLAGSGSGPEIDSHDFVARVKSFRHPDSAVKDLGSRTDFVYAGIAVEQVDLSDIGSDPTSPEQKTMRWQQDRFKRYEDVKFVISCYPKEVWFSHRFEESFEGLRSSGICDCRFLSSDKFFEVSRQINCRPQSGFGAIIDLLQFPIKSLHIYGIDFHRSMYRDGYIRSSYTREALALQHTHDDQGDYHNPDLEYDYFKKEIWNKDSRVKPNKQLQAFLEDDKFDIVFPNSRAGVAGAQSGE